MNDELFQKNLDLIERYRPDVSVRLGLFDSSSAEWSKTDLGEPNIKVHEDGKTYYIHSQKGAVAEAEEAARKLRLLPTNVLVIFGVGLGYYFDALKSWLEDDYRRKLIFFEDNHAVIQRLLETERGTQILEHPQVTLQYFRGEKDQWISSTFWSCFDHSLPEFNVNFDALASYQKERPTAVTSMRSLTYYFAYNVPSAMESINFRTSLEANNYHNLFEFIHSHNFDTLMGKFTQVPAIICGAGSSLDADIPLLKQCRDHAIIFAGGSTLNILSDAGIIPNFSAGGDPTLNHYSRVLMNKVVQTPFLYVPRMEYRAVDSLQGDLVASAQVKLDSFLGWVNKELDLQLVDFSGGYSVSNYCIAAAHFMGCNPIILLGIDLAQSQRKEYAKGVKDHPIVNQYNFARKGGESTFTMQDVSGSPIVTNYQFIAESDWISRFAETHSDVTLINCSKYGKEIPGVIFRDLTNIMPSFLKNSYDLGSWIHSELHSPSKPLVTQDQLLLVLRRWQNSLRRCAEISSRAKEILTQAIADKKLSDVDSSLLAVEEMSLNEELAYTYYFSHLDKRLSNTMKLWEMLWGYKDTRLKEKSFEEIKLENRYGRYNFIHLKAEKLVNNLQNIIEQNTEQRDFSQLHIPAAEGVCDINTHSEEENYEVSDNELIIVDKELGLDFREPFYAIPVAHEFDVNKPVRSILQEKDNLLQGQSVIYYPSGTPQGISYYRNSLLHGPSTYYNTNGNLSSRCWYVNGKKQGKEWRYYSTGSLYSLTRYKDGVYQGQQEFFYPDGSKKTVLSYSMGLLNGESIFYYPNGHVKRIQHFSENFRQGHDRIWSKDDQLLFEILYAKDTPTGIARSWYENGKPEVELHLDALGNLLFLKHWDVQGNLIQRKGEDQEIKKGLEQLTQIAISINTLEEEIMEKFKILTRLEKQQGIDLMDKLPKEAREALKTMKEIQDKLKKGM